VVDGGEVADLEEVEGELDADVGVAGVAPRAEHAGGGLVEEDAGELGDRVVYVGDAERLDAELVAARLERRVPHPRPAEGEDGDRGGAVEAELGEVVGGEERQRAAHAVAGERDADVLAAAGVGGDEAGHLAEELLPAAPGAAEAARLVGGGVEAEEPGLHLDVGARVARVEPRRLQRAHEVGHPLGGGDRAPERDEHVAPPEPPRHLVGGHRDVPDPPPAPARRRLHGRHADVRRRVDVAGDLVPGAAHPDLLQHPLPPVLAVEVPPRRRVQVERLVARAHQLAVPRHLPPQHRVRRRLQHPLPIPAPLHLPPHPRHRLRRLPRRPSPRHRRHHR
ncbi:Os01g0900300, partial [Oryza sativa Japonica Group]